MTAGKTKKSEVTPSREVIDHNRELLLALSQAAQSIQQVHEPEDIYQAVGEQIKALGFEATILTFTNNEQSLRFRYTTISQRLIHSAETLAGLTAQEYNWPVFPDDVYGKIILEGKAEYIPWAGSLFAEALPLALQPLATQIMKILGAEQGIIAPLKVGEENFGVLIVFGNKNLSREDLPAIDSFAGQVAISMRNTRLTKQVEIELAERKRAEKALFESERYYRTLIENATDGILVVNMDGTIRYGSPSVGRILGYGPDALMGTSAFDLIHPDDLTPIFEAFTEGLQTPGFIHRGEYRLRHSSGEWRYFEIISHYLLEDPVVAGIIVNGRDITDRKQAEETLVKSEKQYRLLAESMADVVWVLDAQTLRFKYVSPSVEKLLGYNPEEMLELSLDQVIFPDSLNYISTTFPDRIRQFLEGDPTAVTELATVDQWRKDGSSVLTEVVSTLVLNEKMELEAIGVSRDITQRKQVENELRSANESLETAHRELQKMFAHEQLLARTDGLTGLYNRRYFFELATREFRASMRYQRPLTIILFDVDGFKQANDTFGHATGDAILFQIAQTTTAQIRSVDVLARYGGDEFIILLPQTHAQEAFLIAERIRNSVAATHVAAENSPFIVTLSLGVAENLSLQDVTVEDIIRRADKALYQVKQNGGNHTLIFTSE
jgi:diguanylate cyclase (GGDEF)-like protein/PAS domain S-box-containing protein